MRFSNVNAQKHSAKGQTSRNLLAYDYLRRYLYFDSGSAFLRHSCRSSTLRSSPTFFSTSLSSANSLAITSRQPHSSRHSRNFMVGFRGHGIAGSRTVRRMHATDAKFTEHMQTSLWNRHLTQAKVQTQHTPWRKCTDSVLPSLRTFLPTAASTEASGRI